MIHLGKTSLLVSALLVLASLCATAKAAKAGDGDSAADRLGDRFSSLAAGISFRPPAGAPAQQRLGIGADIVQYTNREERWSLKVSRLSLEQPTRLLGAENDKKALLDAVKPNPGLVDETVRQLLTQNAATEILRKDLVNVGSHDVGIIISRFTQAAKSWLRQQAFVQANDQLYYIFDFTTPSNHTPADKPTDVDPTEAMAVEIFTAMIDSVELLDQRALLEDNKERLFRTRALQVNLPKRLQQAAAAEQYFRVIRDGKDIGWSFVSEDVGERQGKKGVFVAMLSHGQPDANTNIDVRSEMFACLDFKTADEAWLSITNVDRAGKAEQMTELGQSDKRMRRIFDEKTGLPDEKDRRQPLVRNSEQYSLSVTQTTQAGNQPITRQPEMTRQLPPFYLPQAMAWMLPRTLPLNETKTYLFVSWVAAEQSLIHRYVDVEREREVKFNGQKVRAVVVKDRIGLEGEVTLHYLSADGKYLGSHMPSTAVTVVATDQQTLTRLWPNAVLVRPHLLDAPASPSR